MIHTLIGDLFESQHQTLVNTVNCVGVMGKGIALQFKKRFPEMFKDYVARCEQGRVKLGEPYLYKPLLPPWILNFPTKDHWRSVSRLSDIVQGLEYLAAHYEEWGIRSLAVPPLGCGHGGLEWHIVGPTLYRQLGRLDIPVEIYAPHGTPDAQLSKRFFGREPGTAVAADTGTARERLRAGWIGLVEILARITREPYRWPVGRTALQKIAYFATQEGLPTGLAFDRGSYGPFSPGLKPLVTRLVNNGLICEERVGRMLAVKPGPAYQDGIDEFRKRLEPWEKAISRVANLFLRMNTKQAEIAATVDFSTRALQNRMPGKPNELDVLEEVMKWKQKRKPPLDRQEVARSIRGLNLQGWLDVLPSQQLQVSTEAALDV